MDTNSAPILSLYNVCRGAADEVFKHQVDRVIDNIVDQNTSVDEKRTVTMKFTFLPLKDRTGATVDMRVESKLSGVLPVEGTMFFTRRAGELVAVPYDPKQEELFTMEDKEIRRDS